MKRLFWALFALVLVAPGASAGVRYDWVNLTPSVDGYVIAGTIIFSDLAGHQGSASGYQNGDGVGTGDSACQQTPYAIESLNVELTGAANLSFNLNNNIDDMCPKAFGDDRLPINNWDYSLALSDTLSGELFVRMYSDHDIWMSGSSAWGIDNVGSDFYSSFHCPPYGGTQFGDPCTGLSGQWVRVSGSIPTPSAVVLIGFGLFGLLCFGRISAVRRTWV